MRFAAAVFALAYLALVVSSSKGAREEPRIVEKVTRLPVAPSNDFEFRKTKLFFLSEKAPKAGQGARQTSSTLGGKSNSPSQKTATLQDAPITFERQYRMFGAVTALDQRQRFGNYLISSGGPSALPMSQCVWNIVRRNCMSTYRHRRSRIEM